MSRKALVQAAFCFLFFAPLSLAIVCSSEAGEDKKAKLIPPLEETVRIVLDHNHFSSPPGAVKEARIEKMPADREDLVAETKRVYYEIQYKKEQLSIAEEVKGYFERALSKAEEKFESGGGEVTQSSITKLKLGMASALNDIIKLNSDLQVAKLSLARMMGREFPLDSELADDKISPLKFQSGGFDEYLKNLGRAGGGKEDALFALHKAFIRMTERRDKMSLADKNRRMTRALLVTEVANYDFGIGNSEDLFQSLIIYTRVSSGYYESVYDFNMAVVELNQAKTRFLN